MGVVQSATIRSQEGRGADNSLQHGEGVRLHSGAEVIILALFALRNATAVYDVVLLGK